MASPVADSRPEAELETEIAVIVLCFPFVFAFLKSGAFRRSFQTTNKMSSWEAISRASLACVCFHTLMAVAEYSRRCFQGRMVNTALFVVAVGGLVLLLVALSRRVLAWGVWPGDLLAAPAAAIATWCLANKGTVSMIKRATPLDELLQLPAWCTVGNSLCVSGLLAGVLLLATCAAGAMSRELTPQEVESTMPPSSILTDDSRVLSACEARLPSAAVAALYDGLGPWQHMHSLCTSRAVAAAVAALPPLPRDALIVEVGCGAGHFARRVLSMAACAADPPLLRYVGLDVSPRQLRLAQAALAGTAAQQWTPQRGPNDDSPEQQLVRWMGVPDDLAAGAASSLAAGLGGPIPDPQATRPDSSNQSETSGFALLHSSGQLGLPWLPPTGVDVLAAVYVLDTLPSAAIGRLLATAHAALKQGGVLVIVSLTFGRTPVSSTVTSALVAAHEANPAWVGGSRPISVMGHVASYSTGNMSWRIVKHDFISEFGITSEVLLLQAEHGDVKRK